MKLISWNKKYLFAIFGTVLIVNIVLLIFMYGFSVFRLLLGIAGLSMMIISFKIENVLKLLRGLPKWFFFFLKIVLCIFVCSFLFVESLIIYTIYDTRRKTIENEVDYVIILGCQVYGTNPSIALHNRVFAASKYLQKYQNVKVIVSGGQGSGEYISEAEAMKRLLMHRDGISEDRILMEERSTSTTENLRFSNDLYNIVDKNIIIVTSDYHIFRSLRVAKRLNYKSIDGIASRSSRLHLPGYLLREYFSVMYYALSGRI